MIAKIILPNTVGDAAVLMTKDRSVNRAITVTQPLLAKFARMGGRVGYFHIEINMRDNALDIHEPVTNQGW